MAWAPPRRSCRALPGAALLAALCTTAAALPPSELMEWKQIDGTKYAVLKLDFYRSVVGWSDEFEVAVAAQGGASLDEFVVDFADEPPASGLALVGTLSRSPDGLDFEVTGAVGPWERRLGGQPRLRRLRLREDAALGRSGVRLKSSGLVLSHPIGGMQDAVRGGVPVDLALDTSQAYHWMRFPGHLDYARYIIRAIEEYRSTSPEEEPLFVDLGGGSGWMSVLVKANLPSGVEVLCTDIAGEALELARADALANGLEISVAQGDMFEPVRQHRERLPEFVFFFPPQDVGAAGADACQPGGPDVSLLVPENDPTHFHRRFCQEADVAPGGVAWLGVSWRLLPAVAQIACEAGWSVSVPADMRTVDAAPATMLELRRPPGPLDIGDCAREAQRQIAAMVGYQVRGVGAADDAERVELFREGAKQGSEDGLANLGFAYLSGWGVEPDMAMASLWLNRGARAGSEAAMYNLGRLLLSTGRPRHAVKAARWFRRAAEHGHAGAQAGLGYCYQDGLGVEKDDAAAAVWFERSADQGESGAQTSLALLHLERRVARPDQLQAARWLRMAAGAGDGKAQAVLRANPKLMSAGLPPPPPGLR